MTIEISFLGGDMARYERLKDKVAIVTGASRGCGEGIAKIFAEEGAKVAVVSRTRSSIARVVSEIEAEGGTAIGIPCDVGKRDEVMAMVEQVAEQLGTVDVLVNNAQGFGTESAPAGSPNMIPLEHYDEAEWDYIYRTGLLATFWSMKAAFPYLKRRGGKIINFGSSGGIQGFEFQAAYNATKEGIRGLSRTAAREWGQYGINVNIINPTIRTDAMKDWFSHRPGQLERDVASAALRRFGEPEDVGRVAVFLASSDSDYLTGMTMLVNGGRFMTA